jgi:hypothetical protein
MELKIIIFNFEVRLKRPIIACSLSYADYRPKTNAVMLLDTGHILRETGYGRDKEREGNQTLEWS